MKNGRGLGTRKTISRTVIRAWLRSGLMAFECGDVLIPRVTGVGSHNVRIVRINDHNRRKRMATSGHLVCFNAQIKFTYSSIGNLDAEAAHGFVFGNAYGPERSLHPCCRYSPNPKL
jgi:hypothetical protein